MYIVIILLTSIRHQTYTRVLNLTTEELPADLRETLEITECASVLFLADDLETSDLATDVRATWLCSPRIWKRGRQSLYQQWSYRGDQTNRKLTTSVNSYSKTPVILHTSVAQHPSCKVL
ncbi:hypothetical protein EB796_015707 [Bugula neritina]|uniref:Uncharacterized protein n=1 Tax=Bugula neritina TaxID=10212 RepID=A0A7J7JKU6_BUGNE|nr:hypothetical protein EB796_015707 [Bugula neritina]